MTDPVRTPDRAAFEQCSDDGPFDEEAWSTIGHFEPSLPLLVRLGRAMRYDTGYVPAEVRGLLGAVRWSKGYVGKHPTMYDLVACDEEGIAQNYCDDDGNEVTCTDVQPCTWATVKLDPSRAGAGYERDRKDA
jgi:hypothetical protein